ncbi:hypothetical protein A3C98_00600 [Candidatus Roizmanbacteria bacterium RIFCSPHIGHO2_02_FULL_37_15]|nr:MAG: hypothetical protein A3C98_00600 [Candidatus Roizmanbacteria bacterium RIFCSPHIGHO2_02_FULL_37_15]
MDQIPFQVLFLLVAIGAAVYLNRNNFSGVAQKVLGYYIPRPIIALTISLILGIFLWILINMLLLRFR